MDFTDFWRTFRGKFLYLGSNIQKHVQKYLVLLLELQLSVSDIIKITILIACRAAGMPSDFSKAIF